MLERTWKTELWIKWYMFRRSVKVWGRDFRRDMYAHIGYHIHNKHCPDRKGTRDHIDMLKITGVYYSRGYLYILSDRPGFIIGKKGRDIDELTEYFKSTWKYLFPLKGIRLKDTSRGNELNALYLWEYGYEDWDG